jgi:hypothetical protein
MMEDCEIQANISVHSWNTNPSHYKKAPWSVEEKKSDISKGDPW